METTFRPLTLAGIAEQHPRLARELVALGNCLLRDDPSNAANVVLEFVSELRTERLNAEAAADRSPAAAT